MLRNHYLLKKCSIPALYQLFKVTTKSYYFHTRPECEFARKVLIVNIVLRQQFPNRVWVKKSLSRLQILQQWMHLAFRFEKHEIVNIFIQRWLGSQTFFYVIWTTKQILRRTYSKLWEYTCCHVFLTTFSTLGGNLKHLSVLLEQLTLTCSAHQDKPTP
jgi:hypothetical protein